MAVPAGHFRLPAKAPPRCAACADRTSTVCRAVKPVLCIAPYLPLRESLRIGPWHVRPVGDAATILSGDDLRFARRLGKAYGIQKTDRHGAIAYRRPRTPLEFVTGRDMHRLNLALMCAVLDANEGAVDQLDCTSENALVFAHPIGDGSFTSYQEGALLTTLRGISLDGSQRINPPAELVIADRAREIDAGLASAFYRGFARGDDGRRLTLAAEWLQIASRNTTMVALGARVIALRSGFETLLNVGPDYVAQGNALHQLVESPTVRRWPRSWSSLKSKPLTDNLTALQWWFYNFGFLRNKIAHGSPVTRADWRWKGEHQLTKAERELRRAMRCQLVRLGDDPLLKLPYPRRVHVREARRIAAIMRKHRL
jgi:hypothetical protein